VDEYVDEDKYTTVTIEAMDDAKALAQGSDDDDDDDQARAKTCVKDITEAKDGAKKRTVWLKGKKVDFKDLPKKKKFRYESKGERKQTRDKQRSKNSAAKKAREGAKA
jgi:ribosomal RNA-processing protein 17